MYQPSKADQEKLKQMQQKYKNPQQAVDAVKQLVVQGAISQKQLEAFAQHVTPALDANGKARLASLLKQINGK